MSRFLRLHRVHQYETAHSVAQANREPSRIDFDTLDRTGVDCAEDVLEITNMEWIEQALPVKDDADLPLLTAAEVRLRRHTTRGRPRQPMSDTQGIFADVGHVPDRASIQAKSR